MARGESLYSHITLLLACAFSISIAPTRSEDRPSFEPLSSITPRELSLENVRPLPPGPIQRYHIDRNGGRVIDGGTAGATGTLVYKNTMGTNFFAPGTNTQIADDILTIASGGCDMSFLQVLVTGGGNGSGPGFNASFALLTNCPGQGGTEIPGTTLTEMLPNNGAWHVTLDLEGMEVTIPENPWLRMSFSNATAGWVFGRPAEVGFTGNIFHHPQFPCSTIFQGGVPYSGFYAEIWCGGDVEAQFEAYRANEFSGFLDVLTATDLWADDIVPITSPDQCEFVRYDTDIAGLMGNYSMKIELYTNDTIGTTPLAPIMGTSQTCNGAGGGALVTCTKTVFPGIMIPTAEFWIGYDLLTGQQAGPILVSDFPQIGFSEDGYSIFGNPDAGQWSPPVWEYGGCPDVDGAGDPVPCGTFQNTIYCAGVPPIGACCDILTGPELNCADGVEATVCSGRWHNGETCSNATFDPPCGTASCCKPDGSCEDLTSDACATAMGSWQPGQFCGLDTQTCPPGACITATNACSEENNNAGGCADIDCCSTVCSVDAFCCDTAWDSSCVGIAAASCDPTAPNDACAAAIAIGNGIFNFDTTLATTDGPGLPASCDEGFGNAFGHDVWFDFTAPISGMTAIDLCDGTEFDSRMSVYTGCACPVTNATLAACNENNCGDPIEVGGASAVSFPVTAGTCYKIRIGGFGDAVGTGSGEVVTTPSTNWGSCCGSDGSCQETEQETCRGAWTSMQFCNPNSCPQPGSCCDPTGSCTISIESQCATGTWTLAGQCSPNTCPQPPSVMAVGSRYIAVTPDVNQSSPVGLRVTSQDFDCVDQYVSESGLLSHLALIQTPQEWGTVYVADAPIVPNSSYTTFAEGSPVTAPVTVTTWHFGDTNNDLLINLDDILCELAAFSGNYSPTCTLYSADQIGGFFNPDRVVNLDDILAVLNAFTGQPYPGPYPCP